MLLAWHSRIRPAQSRRAPHSEAENVTERRPNPNRKDENIRRANRVIQTRSFVLMLVMGVGMFVLLFFQLFDLQIVRHAELQSKAVNQLVGSSKISTLGCMTMTEARLSSCFWPPDSSSTDLWNQS